MIITQNPPEICNAYNDIIIEFTAEETDGATAEIDIDHEYVGGNDNYDLSREYFNDVARFNLSHLVKKLFRDVVDPIEAGDDGVLKLDNNLFVEVTVLSDATEAPNIIALNSVAQSGAPFLIAENDIFLSKSTRLKKYVDFPLSVSFLRFESDIKYCFVNGVGVVVNASIYQAFQPLVTIIIEDGTQVIGWWSETTLPEFPIPYPYIFIDSLCTPANPFYIRYIQGGDWQYQMFSRHFIKQSAQNGATFAENESTEATIKISERRLNVDASKTIDVGADQLTKAEYESLSFIPFSPKVQLWDTVNSQWIDIIPTGSNENTYDSRSSLQSVRLSFLVPQLTQF